MVVLVHLSLAAHISDLVDSTESSFKTLYEDDMSLWEKTRHIARTIYGADRYYC